MIKAYDRLVQSCDLVQVLFRFYQVSVDEMALLWINTDDAHKDVFPDEPSVHAAISKLERTVEPMLRFGVVHLASAFEDYLADVYVERLEGRLLETLPKPEELRLTDEYRVRVEDFGGESQAWLAQERERFAQKPGWRNKFQELNQESSIDRALLDLSEKPNINEPLVHQLDDLAKRPFRIIEEVMEVRNLILHNSGRATKRFSNRFPDSPFIRDEEVKADADSIELARNVILEVCWHLDRPQ